MFGKLRNLNLASALDLNLDESVMHIATILSKAYNLKRINIAQNLSVKKCLTSCTYREVMLDYILLVGR